MAIDVPTSIVGVTATDWRTNKPVLSGQSPEDSSEGFRSLVSEEHYLWSQRVNVLFGLPAPVFGVAQIATSEASLTAVLVAAVTPSLGVSKIRLEYDAQDIKLQLATGYGTSSTEVVGTSRATGYVDAGLTTNPSPNTLGIQVLASVSVGGTGYIYSLRITEVPMVSGDF